MWYRPSFDGSMAGDRYGEQGGKRCRRDERRVGLVLSESRPLDSDVRVASPLHVTLFYSLLLHSPSLPLFFP